MCCITADKRRYEYPCVARIQTDVNSRRPQADSFVKVKDTLFQTDSHVNRMPVHISLSHTCLCDKSGTTVLHLHDVHNQMQVGELSGGSQIESNENH